MITFAWAAFEVAIAVFEIIVYFDFFNCFFGRKSTKKFYPIVFGAMVLINSFMSVFFNAPTILLINGFAMNILIVTLLFEGKYLLKLFSAIFLIVLGLLAEVISGLLISALGMVDINTVITLDVYRITGIAVSKIVIFVIVKIVGRFRKAQLGDLKVRNWLMLMLIPLISIFTIYQIAFSIAPMRTTWPLITMAGILYINVLVFTLFEALMRQAHIEVKYKLMEQQIEYQTNYYKNLSESRMEIRKIWHDLKNHLICLFSMAADGNLTGIKEYINSLHAIVEEAVKTIDTGNPVIDALLSEKQAFAKREEIAMEVEILIPKKLRIDPIDACILLGNTLDNAIEASMKAQSKEISVKFIQKENHLLLTVINPTDGKLEKDNAIYKTTKEDAIKHGFGLLNIKNIVEKYDGNLMLTHEDNLFTLKAILALK